MSGKVNRPAGPPWPAFMSFSFLDFLFFLGDLLIELVDEQIYAGIDLEGSLLKVSLQAPAEIGGDLQFVVFGIFGKNK
jgi:hypothetical protein